MKRVKLWNLKRKMRAALLAYSNMFANRHGGHFICQTVSPRMHELAVEFDRLADECAKLDPTMPKRDTKLAAF